MRLLAMVVMGLVAACSQPVSGGGGSNNVCVPNQTFDCKCPGDASGEKSGVQVCNQLGNGLEECECEGAGAGSGDTTGVDTDADAGTETDTATDEGGTTEDDGGPCLEEFEKKCVGSEIYWFDSCDNQGALVADCQTGGCLDGVCQGECTPKVEKKCHNGHPWWFNSCGEPESGAEICEDEQFCVNSSCVKPFYNGTWEVTADPDTKSLGIAGSVTFPPTLIDLTINGTSADASVINFPIDVEFTGTLEGKVLKMNASYDEGGETGAHHEQALTVTFKDPQKFTGTIIDEVSADVGLGPMSLGKLVWNVTGIKQ